MGDILTQVSIFGVLLAFLVVGFLYKKKPRNMKEYALGGRKISTSALIATMVATAIGGGSIIGKSAALYKAGTYLVFATCFMPIGYCLTAIFVIPKLSRYYGCLSVAEVMGKMYGRCAQRFVGVAGFVFCVGVLYQIPNLLP